MELIYKKADINDIADLVDLKIKQSIYNCNKEGIILQNENVARENIKKVLIKELNKTIHFFIAIDKNNNRTVAGNGVVVYQLVPSSSFLNGKKAYITSVYTDEDYRCKGIQNVLMQNVLDFLDEIECSKIELDAVNPYAIKLYEKFGFKKDNKKYFLDN